MSEQQKTLAFWGLLLLMAGVNVLLLCGFAPNFTPSLPLGVYKEGNGPLVVWCPTGPALRISNERDYRGVGFCPDHRKAIVKPVLGRPGDRVTLSASGFSLNGQPLANTRPLARDRAGRPLEHYAFGTYTVKQGALWLVSTYSPYSWDSRYFGPVSENEVTRAHAVWTGR